MRLELGGNEPVARVDLIVLLEGAPRFVLGLLELLGAERAAGVVRALELQGRLDARLDAP